MLEEKNKKNVLLVVLVILVLAIFVFYYFTFKNKALAPSANTDITTSAQKETAVGILDAKSPAITKTEKATVAKQISEPAKPTQPLSPEEKKNVLNILNN